ncbi:hypothetical protein OIO90_001192 [Microbotryomycetes sp. JL221]|nr:hypothetical protein OIO90_001192 [Microbotryomycetes sp. JL221]
MQHTPAVHPCAPADLASSSPFLSSLPKTSSSSSNSASNKHGSTKDNNESNPGPLLGPAGGSAPGSGFDTSDAPQTQFEEWNLPAYLSRSRWAPSGDELDAIMTGGASLAPEVTKATKQKWYTAQI